MSALGAVVGIVTSTADPKRLGRVRVRLPSLGNIASDWIRVAVPLAGKSRGMFFIPDVNDEVLIVFLNGDVRFPFVIGGLWNATDPAPVDNGNGENNLRMIRSRSGHAVIFDDTQGKETFTFVDATGKNSLVIETGTNTVTISAEQDITLSAPKGTIKLAARVLELTSAETATLAATGDLKLSGDHVDIN